MLGKMIVIAGTTASGKSDLGVTLAEKYNGEIISADSRQVYRSMDLGSGKITPGEMRGIPHHLLDVCDPGCFFSMADFQRLAYRSADDILAKGKTPFLVGGTGLYVNAVADGYILSDKSPDLELRARLEGYETSELYDMLKTRLPDTQIDPRNRNRVMRALERLAADDYHPGRHEPRYRTLKIGVRYEREILKKRIDERLMRRLDQGMVDEVRNLMDQGITEQFLLKLGLEYRYLTLFITGRLDYSQMVTELGNAIKRFAKRQITWFKRDPDIHWLNMNGDPIREASDLIEEFLNNP